MIRILSVFVFLANFFVFGFGDLKAQQNDVVKKDVLQTIPPVPIDYESSPAHPFGRLNPEAPVETEQLSFLIGEFDCEDRIYNPQNTTWYRMDVVRKAEYVMNGYAIQDKNWTSLLTSTNIRAYDPATKEWHITYFRTKPYSSGVWKGGKEAENMVFRQERGKTTSRLTFFDIGENGYSWKAENVTDRKAVMNWEFNCKRRR